VDSRAFHKLSVCIADVDLSLDVNDIRLQTKPTLYESTTES